MTPGFEKDERFGELIRQMEKEKAVDPQEDNPICDDTGICKPHESDYQNSTAYISNCVHCGKEMIRTTNGWKTYDSPDSVREGVKETE